MRLLRYILSISFLFLSFPSHSSTMFIDIDLTKSEHKTIRIAKFDTYNQEFLNLDYISMSSNTSSPVFKDDLLTLDNKGNLSLTLDSKASYNLIIRTFGSIFAEGLNCFPQIINTKVILFLSPISHKDGKALHDHLMKFTNNDSHPLFNARFHEGYNFPQSKTLRDLNIPDERCILGELATEMTMLTYGYQKRPSQNRSNQGFDGVYQSNDGQFLFLTESKCRQETTSAKQYLKTSLNESTLFRQINTLEEFPETKSLIEEFIENRPKNIYRLAHRLKTNGKFECALSSFNVDVYRLVQLTQEIIEQEDEQNTSNNYVHKKSQLSPGKALQHMLNLYGLSPTEGIALLAIQTLESQQRNNVFSQFSGESIIPTVSPSIETPQRNVEIKEMAGEYSTVQLSSQMSQLSFHTPPPSPLSRSATPKTTPKKEFNPPRKGPAIPHQQFGGYSKDNLSKFIKVVSGEGSARKHIGRYSNHEFYMNHRVAGSPTMTDKPFKTLQKGGEAKSGKDIWEVLTDQENFKDLCGQLKMSEEDFIDEWTKGCTTDAPLSPYSSAPLSSYQNYSGVPTHSYNPTSRTYHPSLNIASTNAPLSPHRSTPSLPSSNYSRMPTQPMNTHYPQNLTNTTFGPTLGSASPNAPLSPYRSTPSLPSSNYSRMPTQPMNTHYPQNSTNTTFSPDIDSAWTNTPLSPPTNVPSSSYLNHLGNSGIQLQPHPPTGY